MNWTLVQNAALFQLTWFGCVAGGARSEWWWGAIGVCALAAFSHWRGTLRRDLPVAATLILVGLGLGVLWTNFGVLDFGGRTLSVAGVLFSPVWIYLLWAGVGLTVMHSLSFFVARPWLGAIMAGGAAVPCYLGGERLGAVVIPEVLNLGWIVTLWALVFFLVFSWARAILAREEAQNPQASYESSVSTSSGQLQDEHSQR